MNISNHMKEGNNRGRSSGCQTCVQRRVKCGEFLSTSRQIVPNACSSHRLDSPYLYSLLPGELYLSMLPGQVYQRARTSLAPKPLTRIAQWEETSPSNMNEKSRQGLLHLARKSVSHSYDGSHLPVCLCFAIER